MRIRDPQFTLQLEPALRHLVKSPAASLEFIARRYDVDKIELFSWLKAFNRGSAEGLTDARIDLVKREVGAIAESRPAKAVNAPPPVSAPGVGPTSDIGRWLEVQRAKVTGRVNCFQVEVTPALASAWLALNTGNRHPSQAKIRRFAVAMKNGRWTVNGETVKFSVSGRLLDGQSRLMAIVLAGVPVVLEVRAGLPDVAQESMDVGELRKGAHVLEMLGEKNPSILSSSLKLVWLWKRGWLGGYPFRAARVMENNEVHSLLTAHAALKASVGWTVDGGANIERVLLRSEAAFFHYLFGTIDANERDLFFEALSDGVSLTKASPIYHLREQLLADRGNGDSTQRKRMRRGLVILAWNGVRRGDKVSKLRYAATEPFPEVDGIANPQPEKAQNFRVN